MYLSLLGNLSLWSVIANASSYGKSGRVEAGRCIARTSLYKYVSLLSRLYIFIVAEAQILCRILSNYKVIIVTDMCDPEMIRKMHMEHAKTFDEALARAFELKGGNATVSLIPDGVSVIVR